MAQAPRDENFVPTALFEIDGSSGSVMPGQIDQSTGRILVDNADTTFDLTVSDGGTSVSNVDTIVFSGATVTDDTGGQVTVTIDTPTADTLAAVSAVSDDATKSLYTMTSTIPVEFESSDSNTILYLDETNERVGIGTNATASAIGSSTLSVNGSVDIGAGSSLYFGATTVRVRRSSSNLFLDSAGSIGLNPASGSNVDVNLTAAARLAVMNNTNANDVGIIVENTNTGTASAGSITLGTGSNLADCSGSIKAYSSGFTTSGLAIADTFAVRANSAASGGLVLATLTTAPIIFGVNNAQSMSLSGTVFAPTTTDGVSLGSSSLNWSDLFLASGGVINWSSGDVTITHASNTLTFAGATSGYQFSDGPIAPSSNDGVALGTTALQFSDLFLASGAVINFNNGDVTLTHSSNLLTLGGGNFAAGDNNITGAGSISFTQELDNGSKTTSFTIDFANDQKQLVTLTANTMTLTLDTTSVGVGNYILRIVNGGLATLTWASETGSVLWPGGADPTLTSSGTDVVAFYYNGTNWYGQAGIDFS